jgi:hypothetical protein
MTLRVPRLMRPKSWRRRMTPRETDANVEEKKRRQRTTRTQMKGEGGSQ